MAFVLGVIAFSIAAGSIQNVRGSTSTKTGVSLRRAITSVVAIYVKDGVITSSPGCNPSAIIAIWSASVPLAHGMVYLAPT